MPYKDIHKRREAVRKSDRRQRERATDLTVDILKTVVLYDLKTGTFTRLKSFYKRHIGQRADKLSGNGYRVIRILGRVYPAHRVAWMYVYGRWPSDLIDHINGNPVDNRISNLRECTSTQNQANARPRKDNASGYKGVFFCKISKKWIAYLDCNGSRINLGRFKEKSTAIEARAQAEIAHFGEFTWRGAA